MSGITVNVQGNIADVIKTVTRIPKEAAKLEKQLPRELGKIVADIAADEASKVYWIKKGRVKKAVSKTNAGIIIRGRRQNVADFRMTPNKPGKRRKNGIRVAVMRAGGLKTIRRGFVIHGWASGKIIGMLRLGRDFFRWKKGENPWRSGVSPLRGESYQEVAGQYNIAPLTAPAIPQLMQNDEVQAGIESRIQKEAIDALNLWAGRYVSGRRVNY